MSEPTAYDVLGVSLDVSEADLRRAYRAQALKVHPDRHRDDPVAGQKFHELTEAFEVLSDPVKRGKLDDSIRARLAKTQRYDAHNAKRKQLIDELEESEHANKRQRQKRNQEHNDEEDALTRIKKESQQLRQARADAHKPTQLIDPQSSFLVKLKFHPSQFPSLTSREAVVDFLKDQGLGPLHEETVVVSFKSPKNRPHQPPGCTALVSFIRMDDAFEAVATSGRKQLRGITATWASGAAPKASQLPGSSGHTLETPADAGSHTGLGDLESATLARLRHAEKAKLEKDIRERDE